MTIEKASKEFLIRDPFYGFFLLGISKEIVPKEHKIKTAAVSINGLIITLYINKEFWDNLTDDEQISVLHHEILHLCLFHLTDDYKAENPYLMNICNDVVVNSFIKNLPSNCVTFYTLSKSLNIFLEPGRGSWYYYKELEKFIKQHPHKCEKLHGFRTIDDHSLWPSDISSTEKILHENQIKSRLKETADYVTKQAGKIPGELSEILKRISNKPPIFNWKSCFKRLVGSSISSEFVNTKMRPNKRFPDNAGVKLKYKPNILIGIDTSGSISNNDLQEFFKEVHHIYKTGVSITVVECDTKINNIFKYKGNQNISIKGRGGTILDDVIIYYKRHHEFSVCVLFTDGYCSTTLPNCRNLIWVITKNGNKTTSYSPGRTIFIPS